MEEGKEEGEEEELEEGKMEREGEEEHWGGGELTDHGTCNN